MDYTHEQVKTMLEGAYKKLKSYYFYDKTLLFIKKRIAEFECDDHRFEHTFDILADTLVAEDTAYFDALIAQLDFQVFPKSFVETSEHTTAIVGAVDHSKNISKVNFFIDVPIELLIIDCLWTVFLAKIGNSKYGNRACSYAGKLKPSIFFFGDDDLYSGIDWKSNRCFEPYYENYSRWQNDAFTKLREGLKSQDQLMFSLDLKSFYYSVRFEFDTLNTLLGHDTRLDKISFISSIEEKLFLAYTQLISKYKIGIDIKNDATIFPIGLLSPIVLREIYLYKFDQRIKEALSPVHYGRYVDDMIIVLPTNESATKITPEYICDLLKEKGLIKKKGSSKTDDYIFIGFDAVAIQQSKINCFFFEGNASNILIELAEKQFRNNSSEANLLPDFDEIKNLFNDTAYFFNSIGGSTKIRDIGILQSNNYAASRSITLMKQLIKNTYITAKDRIDIDKYLNDLLNFYDGSAAFEFMGTWTSIFELFLQLKVLSADKSRRDPFAHRFRHSIVSFIDHNLSFDFLRDKEISIYYFMQSTQRKDKGLDNNSNIEKIWERYTELNNVERFAPENVAQQSQVELNNTSIGLVTVTISNKPHERYFVGLANTTVTEEDALQSLIHPEHKMTMHDKKQLFRMANTAVKENANYITFPEFFIPIVWLKDITRFAQKNNITIVAGLRYIRNSNRAFNCTTIVQPCNNHGFQNTVTLFREKNFYAPEEKECLYKLGYHITNPALPIYYVVHANGVRYSSILCFEFTDIFSRASLKSKVDALFVPQLNKDTNYFSSIVESTSRDLHCFIVQANTSKYGDSRITGPYDTIHKNIVQVKGGINDVVIIGELEFLKVKKARNQYKNDRKKTTLWCYACKRVKRSGYPNFFDPCKKCSHQKKKQTIKDIPANFE